MIISKRNRKRDKKARKELNLQQERKERKSGKGERKREIDIGTLELEGVETTTK